MRELRAGEGVGGAAINEGASLPYFIKIDQGSWLSLPPAESVRVRHQDSFFLLFSCKGKYFGSVVLHQFNHIWSVVARGSWFPTAEWLQALQV